MIRSGILKSMPSKKTKVRRSVTQNACASCSTNESYSSNLLKAGGMLVLITAVYKLASSLDLISFAQNTEHAAGMGAIFVIGLTASASSCLALVGGLLLSVSAKWVESHPKASHWEKFVPLLNFNLGRVAGYFVFGGLTGLLGHVLLPSVRATGVLQMLIALVMIVLGLNILHIVPKKYCRVPLPQALMKRIRKLGESDNVFAASALGAVTYFVPCGFTQSMQLLALGSGSFIGGAVIMLVFALGTLPSLLGISAVGSFTEGKIGKFFLVFAGTMSIFLGVMNVRTGFALTGVSMHSLIPCCSASETADPNVTIDKNGQQIISVTVQNEGYNEPTFTVQGGMPTWIYATAPSQLSGCLSQMAIPAFNVLQPVNQGPNWIGPVTPTKDFEFMCSMGMFRAQVRVRS